jgi:hypothetical protein
MQNRLKHLEGLVKDAMTGQSPSAQPIINDKLHTRKGLDISATSNGHPTPNENIVQNHIKKDSTAASSGSFGQVLLGSSESTYVGATHWAAMIEDVRLS